MAPDDISQESREGLQRPRVDRTWLVDVIIPPSTRRQGGVGGATGSVRHSENIERITDYEEPIEFPKGSGTTYDPMPLEIPTITQDSSPKIQNNTIKVTHLTRRFGKWFEKHDGLVGNLVIIKLIMPDHRRKEDILFEQTLMINKSSFDRPTAQFEVSSFLNQLENTLTRRVNRDLFPNIPKRRTIIQ